MGKREKLYHDSFWEVLMSSDVTVLETEFCCICKSAVRQELIFFFFQYVTGKASFISLMSLFLGWWQSLQHKKDDFPTKYSQVIYPALSQLAVSLCSNMPGSVVQCLAGKKRQSNQFLHAPFLRSCSKSLQLNKAFL